MFRNGNFVEQLLLGGSLTLRSPVDRLARGLAGGIAIDWIRRIAGWRAVLLCGFVLALAGAAALLDHLSLDYDELFSIYFAERGPSFLLNEGWRHETNPPLYFLLLDGWIGLFGDSAVAVRSLSLLFGAATIPVVFAIGRAVARQSGRGDGMAWLAAALYLTTAVTARYALMARPYSLSLLFIAVAALALVQAIDAPPVRVRRWSLIFAAAGLVALYAHDAALFFLAAAEAVFALDWLIRRRKTLRILADWLLPQLLLLGGAAPQLAIILAQRNSANLAWIPPSSLAGWTQYTIELLSGHEYPFGTLQAQALSATVLVLLVVVPLRTRRSAVAPLAALTVLGLALLAGTGILLPRTALWLLIPAAVLQAAALATLPRGWAIGAVALATLNTGFCLWEFQPEPWREYLADLDAARQPGDAVILLNGVPAMALRYYHAADEAELYRWDATPIDGPGTAIRALDDSVSPLTPIDEERIRALLQQGRPSG
ncbi:MAG: glycosyltransferase family 39 protein [Aliidongia sp.]